MVLFCISFFLNFAGVSFVVVFVDFVINLNVKNSMRGLLILKLALIIASQVTSSL